MRTIRLLREVNEPGDRGPQRGMFALQAALRAADLPYLKIGGRLRGDEIPWCWHWNEKSVAYAMELLGWPYIIGPNVLFIHSRKPGAGKWEPQLLAAKHCALCFTESPWYAEIIRDACLTQPGLPLAIFRYPIAPAVPGPLEPEYDVLIYVKEPDKLGDVATWAGERWSRSAYMLYGSYERDELIDLARRSRVCLYLSTDDRGPLAAAEIALAGCPLVGIERGCPWVTNRGLGIRVSTFHAEELEKAVEQAMCMGAHYVKAAAEFYFDTAEAVRTIATQLERIAGVE